MKRARQSRRPGPPKAFNVDRALEAAMFVFWQKGFDGTSLADLTEAMGINRPSLYATFGDKQSLFRRAVKRYHEHGRPIFAESDAKGTARDFVERLLRGTADLYTNPKFPPGCFLIQSAMSTSAPSAPARYETAERRRRNEMAVRRRLERTRDQLPPGLTAAELAAYVASVGNGLAIRAADGASRETLHRIIDLALAFWPATARKPANPPKRKSQI